MTPSAGRFSLEGDTGIGGHVFAMEIEAPSGDLVTIEYRADPSGQVVDRMNFYNEGERILSTAIQWTETKKSGPQVATLQQTSYYQLNPGGTTKHLAVGMTNSGNGVAKKRGAGNPCDHGRVRWSIGR